MYRLAGLGNAGKSPHQMAATYGIPLPPKGNTRWKIQVTPSSQEAPQ